MDRNLPISGIIFGSNRVRRMSVCVYLIPLPLSCSAFIKVDSSSGRFPRPLCLLRAFQDRRSSPFLRPRPSCFSARVCHRHHRPPARPPWPNCRETRRCGSVSSAALAQCFPISSQVVLVTLVTLFCCLLWAFPDKYTYLPKFTCLLSTAVLKTLENTGCVS